MGAMFGNWGLGWGKMGKILEIMAYSGGYRGKFWWQSLFVAQITYLTPITTPCLNDVTMQSDRTWKLVHVTSALPIPVLAPPKILQSAK